MVILMDGYYLDREIIGYEGGVQYAPLLCYHVCMSKTSSKRVNNFIKKATWTEAKSYKDSAPHEYCVKARLSPEMKKEFDWFVGVINEDGKLEPFYRTFFNYYRHDGYKYWVMDVDPKDVEIINRALVEYEYGST